MPTEGEPTARRQLPVHATVGGTASGPALVLDEPLSLWGGLDPHTGRIIDQHHPQRGTCISGAVVLMPFGRGSSSSSSVLVEAVRLGTAPAAFVLNEADEIVALGSLVAEEIYGLVTPVVICDSDDVAFIRSGDLIHIEASVLRVG